MGVLTLCQALGSQALSLHPSWFPGDPHVARKA